MAALLTEKELQEFSEIFVEFAEIPVDPPARRETCVQCRRPLSVCWCPFLPSDPLDIATNVYILQHPYEESRTLKTAPMLQRGLKQGKCHIYKGKRFGNPKYTDLHNALSSPNTLLLYPGPGAVDLQTVIGEHEFYNIVLLDGTWAQARGIYTQNKCLQSIKKVQLNCDNISEYVIRTQPTESALSTLESAAVAISTLENRNDIKEILVKPLRALCNFQLQHGAVVHQSKEYLIENGLYKKQIPKKPKSS